MARSASSSSRPLTRWPDIKRAKEHIEPELGIVPQNMTSYCCIFLIFALHFLQVQQWKFIKKRDFMRDMVEEPLLHFL